MGRVMAEKGIDELFLATHRLVEEGIKCELDVLGGYEEDYKEKIDMSENEGWLHYYGYQKMSVHLLNKAIVLFFHHGMKMAKY